MLPRFCWRGCGPAALPASRPAPRSDTRANGLPRPFRSCSPFWAARLPAPWPVGGWVSSAWCYRSQCSQLTMLASPAEDCVGSLKPILWPQQPDRALGGRTRPFPKLGDGLMALFGHPIAQENDSERAVRAALRIRGALAELNRHNAGLGRPELVARIGIESGALVVDAAGEIFGDAPNSAARVQTLADPGTVLITARVQRRVAGLFVAEDRGLHELKGVPRPVALYRIVRASGGRKGRNAFFVSALAQVPSRRASPAQPEPTTHPALDAA